MPPEYNLNQNASVPPHHKNEVRLVLPALLVILILVGGYAWWNAHRTGNSSVTPTATSTTALKTPKVEVTKTDLTSTSADTSKLPAGFPSSIPVETATIKESYKAAYPDHGLTQYTVSYISTKSKSAIWKTYSDYLSANGYTIDTSSSSETNGTLRGTSGKNELDVIITPVSAGSYVQLGYLMR